MHTSPKVATSDLPGLCTRRRWSAAMTSSWRSLNSQIGWLAQQSILHILLIPRSRLELGLVSYLMWEVAKFLWHLLCLDIGHLKVSSSNFYSALTEVAASRLGKLWLQVAFFSEMTGFFQRMEVQGCLWNISTKVLSVLSLNRALFNPLVIVVPTSRGGSSGYQRDGWMAKSTER